MSKSLVTTAAFAGLLMFGCGTRNVATKGDKTPVKPAPTADAGTVLRKAVAISWSVEKRIGIEDTDPVTTIIKLAQTIETGAKDHSDVGTVEGTCVEKTVDKSGDAKAMLWLYCEWKGKGVQLKVVKHKFDLVVLKGRVEEGDIAYDEFRRIKLPLGARVTTAPMEK